MNFNLEQIYKIFEQYKDSKDFRDYVDEINECDLILHSNPFDIERARQQISKLTTKYQEDLNWLASIYGNGMTVTSQPVTKTAGQIFNDLQYINNHIPLIALRRKGLFNLLKELGAIGYEV